MYMIEDNEILHNRALLPAYYTDEKGVNYYATDKTAISIINNAFVGEYISDKGNVVWLDKDNNVYEG